MITTIHTAYVNGDYDLVPISIEVEIATAGIGIHLVGLPDNAVKETLLRVVTAMQSCGYHIPGKKIVINVKPAIKDKRGTAVLDLPIAIGLLQASRQMQAESSEFYAPCGELALDGTIRHPLKDLPYAVRNFEHNNKQ